MQTFFETSGRRITSHQFCKQNDRNSIRHYLICIKQVHHYLTQNAFLEFVAAALKDQTGTASLYYSQHIIIISYFKLAHCNIKLAKLTMVYRCTLCTVGTILQHRLLVMVTKIWFFVVIAIIAWVGIILMMVIRRNNAKGRFFLYLNAMIWIHLHSFTLFSTEWLQWRPRTTIGSEIVAMSVLYYSSRITLLDFILFLFDSAVVVL